jgi:hypothetical protein
LLTGLGFAIAFGILLDTVVVQPVPVTALNLDLGTGCVAGKLAHNPAPPNSAKERAAVTIAG